MKFRKRPNECRKWLKSADSTLLSNICQSLRKMMSESEQPETLWRAGVGPLLNNCWYQRPLDYQQLLYLIEAALSAGQACEEALDTLCDVHIATSYWFESIVRLRYNIDPNRICRFLVRICSNNLSKSNVETLKETLDDIVRRLGRPKNEYFDELVARVKSEIPDI